VVKKILKIFLYFGVSFGGAVAGAAPELLPILEVLLLLLQVLVLDFLKATGRRMILMMGRRTIFLKG
jgi:hypothetical protein